MRASLMMLERALLDLGEDLFRGVYPRKSRPFHEALPLEERVCVLACEVDVADRLSFVAGDRRELSRHVTSVAPQGQGIRGPVLEVRFELEVGIARGSGQRSGIDLVEIGEEARRLRLYGIGIERRSAISAR